MAATPTIATHPGLTPSFRLARETGFLSFTSLPRYWSGDERACVMLDNTLAFTLPYRERGGVGGFIHQTTSTFFREGYLPLLSLV